MKPISRVMLLAIVAVLVWSTWLVLGLRIEHDTETPPSEILDAAPKPPLMRRATSSPVPAPGTDESSASVPPFRQVRMVDAGTGTPVVAGFARAWLGAEDRVPTQPGPSDFECGPDGVATLNVSGIAWVEARCEGYLPAREQLGESQRFYEFKLLRAAGRWIEVRDESSGRRVAAQVVARVTGAGHVEGAASSVLTSEGAPVRIDLPLTVSRPVTISISCPDFVSVERAWDSGNDTGSSPADPRVFVVRGGVPLFVKITDAAGSPLRGAALIPTTGGSVRTDEQGVACVRLDDSEDGTDLIVIRDGGHPTGFRLFAADARLTTADSPCTLVCGSEPTTRARVRVLADTKAVAGVHVRAGLLVSMRDVRGANRNDVAWHISGTTDVDGRWEFDLPVIGSVVRGTVEASAPGMTSVAREFQGPDDLLVLNLTPASSERVAIYVSRPDGSKPPGLRAAVGLVPIPYDRDREVDFTDAARIPTSTRIVAVPDGVVLVPVPVDRDAIEVFVWDEESTTARVLVDSRTSREVHLVVKPQTWIAGRLRGGSARQGQVISIVSAYVGTAERRRLVGSTTATSEYFYLRLGSEHKFTGVDLDCTLTHDGVQERGIVTDVVPPVTGLAVDVK